MYRLHSLIIMRYSSYPTPHNLHSFRPSFLAPQPFPVVTNPISRLNHKEQRKGESISTLIFVCKFSVTTLANSEVVVWKCTRMCARKSGEERDKFFWSVGTRNYNRR